MVIHLFQFILKNNDQNNICACIVFNAKAEFLFLFYFYSLTPQKVPLWVLKQNPLKELSSYFSFVLALKTMDAQMLF